MDSVVTQLLTRLSMFLQQELDFQVDSRRFAEEKEYSSQVLALIDEMGDQEFKSVAALIRKRQLELFSLKSASAPREVTTPPLPISGEQGTDNPRKGT